MQYNIGSLPKTVLRIVVKRCLSGFFLRNLRNSDYSSWISYQALMLLLFYSKRTGWISPLGSDRILIMDDPYNQGNTG